MSVRPTWVRFALWGAGRRATASLCRALSFVVAGGLATAATAQPRFAAAAGIFFVGGLVYHAAIVWVDRHGRWPEA